jgi:hypothetical protein
MKTRRIAAAVLLALAPQVVALPALAQADDPVTVQARARFKEGVDYYDKGQYENARLAFLQAYALKKHPAVLLNLAQSSSKSGHLLDASKYFQQFLRESGTATPEEKRDAEQGLAEVRSKLGHIEIIAPAGTEITLDDKDRLGTAPFAEPVDVEPGSHTLKSSTETRTVNATAGQRVQAKFGPGTAPGAAGVAPLPAPTGGATTGEPPPSDANAGNANDGTATPPPDADKNKAGLLSPPESMTPVYVGLVVGGVGLIGAIVFAAFKADAQSKADSVANEIRGAAQQRGIASKGVCTSSAPSVQKDFGNACATLEDNNSKVDTNATVANVSLVVMGVGLATAAGWYLFGPKKENDAAPAPAAASASPSVRVEPYAGWGNAGLSVGGTF